MTLPDYPPFTVDWKTGLSPEFLRALGNLAVSSAQVEELLHQVYWHHAGLTAESGPIITNMLNPKRLQEDIIKLASLDKTKANILVDLKLLFSELDTLNTRRNHCLHWIWTAATLTPGDFTPTLKVPYELKRPLYRQSGPIGQAFSVEDVKSFCNDFSWLAYRLRSHTFSDDELREKRQQMANTGTFSIDKGAAVTQFSFADVFWPAPWLDKPPPPDSKPLNPPEAKK